MKANYWSVFVDIEYFRFQFPVTWAPLIRMPSISKLSESNESDSISGNRDKFQFHVKAWILSALTIFKLKIKRDILTRLVNSAQVIFVLDFFWPFLILPNACLHGPILLLRKLSRSNLHLILSITIHTIHQLILLIHDESIPWLAKWVDWFSDWLLLCLAQLRLLRRQLRSLFNLVIMVSWKLDDHLLK